MSQLTMLVRHDGDTAILISGIRDAVHAVDPTVPLWNSVSLSDIVAKTTAEERHWAVLRGIFSM